MDDYLSDDSYVTEDDLQITIEDYIDIYVCEYLDNILDIFFYFEQRFSYTPEFMEHARENSSVLVSFIIDYIFRDKTIDAYEDLTKFELEYKSEIQDSYRVVSNLIQYSSNKELKLKDWVNFCYSMSYIY